MENDVDLGNGEPLPFFEQKNLDSEKKSIFVVLFLGVFGLTTSFFSIFVTTFIGVTHISIQNGATLLVLTLLVMLFIIVKSMNYFFNGKLKLTLIGLLFILLNTILFVLKLIEFISIPIPV